MAKARLSGAGGVMLILIGLSCFTPYTIGAARWALGKGAGLVGALWAGVNEGPGVKTFSRDELKSGSEETRLALAGQDPCAYKDAEELFSDKAPVELSGADEARLTAELIAKIDSGKPIEDPECRTILLALEGTADAAKLRSALKGPIKALGARIGKAPGEIADNSRAALAAANKLYRNRQFEKAAIAYAAILAKAPAYLDARNNLGLSEMHSGNDIAALLQFDAALAVSPGYSGAAMNASVALTRLGMRAQAYEAGKSAAAKNPDSAMLRYNLGWLQNARGGYGAADASFARAISQYPLYAKAALAKSLNALEDFRKPSESDLALLPKALRERLQRVEPSVLSVKADPALPLVKAEGDFVSPALAALRGLYQRDRYLVSEKKEDGLSVYRAQGGTKALVWLGGAGSAPAPLIPWKDRDSKGAVGPGMPSPELPLWWILFGFLSALNLAFTVRAFARKRTAAGVWGLLSLLALGVGGAWLYPHSFPAMFLVGWGILGFGAFNALALRGWSRR